MASISTSIELYDKVSGPINNMISALDRMLGTYESVESTMNAGFDTTPIEQSRQAIDRTADEVEGLERNIQHSQQQQEKFNKSIRNGESAMDGLGKKALGLVTAYASMQTITNAANISDEFTQTYSRLNMMNDGMQTTQELVYMIYESAQDARGSFQAMATLVAKLGNNAMNAFGSTAEIVSFANLIQKQFVIAGASAIEAENAMLQLVQGLASGTLRGDELNSIFEQAPNLIQTIADYLDVPIGKIREMASDGLITAEIVKNAMFAASDEINAKFEQMPMTWGQVLTTMKNAALMRFQPVLDKINELANDEHFQRFASSAVSALSVVSLIVLNLLGLMSKVGAFISDNWSIIEPLVWGIVAALVVYNATMGIAWLTTLKNTAATIAKTIADWAEYAAIFALIWAQEGLNAAMAACPISWIIIMIIALIAIIYAVCAAIAKMTGIANTGFGVITGGINVVIQFFKNLGLEVANIALGIGNAIAALCINMMTAFNNAISSIQSWFYGLMSDALGVIESICAALNKLPFVEFDYSGITASANKYADKASEAAENKKDYVSISDAFSEGFNTFDTFQDGWVSDAFNKGAAWGDGMADKVSNALGDFFEFDKFENGGSNLFDGGYDGLGGYDGYDASQLPSNISDIADDTGSIADSMDITTEELKYLRDLAETEVVNRFTTAEIKVEMTNNNNISSEQDLDGIIDYLATGVNEAMEKAAEGVHY